MYVSLAAQNKQGQQRASALSRALGKRSWTVVPSGDTKRQGLHVKGSGDYVWLKIDSDGVSRRRRLAAELIADLVRLGYRAEVVGDDEDFMGWVSINAWKRGWLAEEPETFACPRYVVTCDTEGGWAVLDTRTCRIVAVCDVSENMLAVRTAAELNKEV
jgi:hypothetical protein